MIAGGGYVQLADSGDAAGLLPGLDRRGRFSLGMLWRCMHAGEGARAPRNRFYGILVRPGRVLTMSL
jgi:hypothetical protein